MKYTKRRMRMRTIHSDYFFRGRGVSLTGSNLNATTTVQLCTEIFSSLRKAGR